MDFLSLVTGSENLYKYLFVGGIALLILSVFYPLNKRYELLCQKDTYNKEIQLANLEIDNLGKKVTELRNRKDYVVKQLDSSEGQGKKNVDFKKNLKDSFNRQFESVTVYRNQIEKKVIEVGYNRQRIGTLETHISEFVGYQLLFLILGSLFSLAGIIGWLDMMLKARKKQ